MAIDIKIFFTLIDDATRKPKTGSVVVLKDSNDGTTIISMSEHTTYKGLYYGTLTSRSEIELADIYVDGNKDTNNSPITLVPSDKILYYNQNANRHIEKVKKSIILWESSDKPLNSDDVYFIDINTNDRYKLNKLRSGIYVVEFTNSFVAKLEVDGSDDAILTNVLITNLDIADIDN